MTSKQWVAFGLLAAMYALHNDWWLWDDRTLAAGLPIGLAYHVGYMVVTAVVLAVVVRIAWPTDLDAGQDR